MAKKHITGEEDLKELVREIILANAPDEKARRKVRGEERPTDTYTILAWRGDLEKNEGFPFIGFASTGNKEKMDESIVNIIRIALILMPREAMANLLSDVQELRGEIGKLKSKESLAAERLKLHGMYR